MTRLKRMRGRRAPLIALVCAWSLAMLITVESWAQAVDSRVLRQTEQAFAQGSARDLLALAGERLELGILGPGAAYSRSQALYVVQAFFREYPPDRCTLQEASAAEASQFATGRYWYEGGDQPLRVYVRFQEEGGTWTLREIRMERSSG